MPNYFFKNLWYCKNSKNQKKVVTFCPCDMLILKGIFFFSVSHRDRFLINLNCKGVVYSLAIYLCSSVFCEPYCEVESHSYFLKEKTIDLLLLFLGTQPCTIISDSRSMFCSKCYC